jgi:hypothetical protein
MYTPGRPTEGIFIPKVLLWPLNFVLGTRSKREPSERAKRPRPALAGAMEGCKSDFQAHTTPQN